MVTLRSNDQNLLQWITYLKWSYKQSLMNPVKFQNCTARTQFHVSCIPAGYQMHKHCLKPLQHFITQRNFGYGVTAYGGSPLTIEENTMVCWCAPLTWMLMAQLELISFFFFFPVFLFSVQLLAVFGGWAPVRLCWTCSSCCSGMYQLPVSAYLHTLPFLYDNNTRFS